jgi:hypothetical protein
MRRFLSEVCLKYELRRAYMNEKFFFHNRLLLNSFPTSTGVTENG